MLGVKFRVWLTTPKGFERIIDIEAGDRVSAIDGARKQAPEGSELRYAGELKWFEVV